MRALVRSDPDSPKVAHLKALPHQERLTIVKVLFFLLLSLVVDNFLLLAHLKSLSHQPSSFSFPSFRWI